MIIIQDFSCGRKGVNTAIFTRQTCMDSKVVRADFGSGLIRPRAQTCCAELRRLARLANSPGFKSFRCPRWRIKFSLERFSDPSRIRLRAQPLESSLGRVPQAADVACNQTSLNRIVSVAEDCLSPERTFHGCTLMQFRGSNSWLYFCALRSIMIDERNHPRLQNITMNPVVVNPISPNANAYPYFQCSSGIKSKFIP